MEPSFSFQTFFILLLMVAAGGTLYFYYFRTQEKTAKQDQSYLLALKHMAENDNRHAIEKFKESVRENSDNIDAYLKLGDILRKEGLAKNAVRVHRDLSLRAGLSEEDKLKIWFSLGLDYWQLNDSEMSENYFKKLINHNDYKLQTIPYLIKVYEQTGRYKEVVQIIKNNRLDKNEKYKTKLILFQVLEANDLAESGDWKGARVLYKEALKKKPDCVMASLFIGDSYVKEERFDDALQVWTDFCVKYPQLSYVLFPRLEKTYFDQGSFNKIQELYETILKAAPENVYTYTALAEILRKKGDYDTALSLISDGQRQEIDQNILNYEMIRILFEKAKYKEAASKAMEFLESLNDKRHFQYSCKQCEFQSKEPFIKCPDCGTIDEHL